MKNRQTYTLFTFFTLYIAQSIPMSFFSSALPVLMRQGAYSLLAIALLKLIKIPWLIKFLWSPIVDSRTESLKDYKQWIFGAEVIYAIIIFIVATLSIEADFTLIIILIILAFISSATQDIATDAMAARSFDRKDTSLLNSIQSMGSFTGSMVGGGFLLLLFHKFGWNSLLPWVAIFVLMALIPLFFIKKIKLRERKVKQKAKPKDMLLFFNQKNIWRQVVFLLLYYAGLIGILSNLSPFLVDIGYDIKEIGGIVGIFGVSFGILCAFISGIYIRKIGKSLSRKIISFLIIVPAVYFIWLSSSGSTDLIFILIGVALVWGIYGMSSTLINTSAMDIVRDGREGTDFTLQIVITHLGAMIITIVSASIGDAFGYKGLFLMQLVIALISFLYVLLFKPYSVKYETMN
ncbi:MAG: MFS transporter [Dysgonamonadaceae bacterium]|nr:MFS transporter [Dysgonamonadaceae bacterium]